MRRKGNAANLGTKRGKIVVRWAVKLALHYLWTKVFPCRVLIFFGALETVGIIWHQLLQYLDVWRAPFQQDTEISL